MSQADLAFVLTELTGTNWDQQAVSRGERGERPFRIVDVLVIARIFGVSVIRLLQPLPPDLPPDVDRNKDEDDPNVFWTDTSPWSQAVRIGTVDYWPDDLLRDFIMEPRGPGDPAASKWNAKDGWPDRLGEPLRDWIAKFRGATEIAAASGVDLDEYIRKSWEDIERQKGERRDW